MAAHLMLPDYRAVSFWLSTVDPADPLQPRPELPGDLDVDVAVVGAGYTGLWTAYYLAGADPSLRIAVVEAQIAGYGASGRNGGWCSALFPASRGRLARRYGRDRASAMYRAMESTVDEVGRVVAEEGIDCHYTKGGTVLLARGRAQLGRARALVEQARAFGFADPVLLTAAQARQRCGAAGVTGGVYTAHCATIHPARLARGLASAVERRGVTIYERTPAVSLTGGRVVCPQGTIRAAVVVRATEAFSTALPGQRRTLVPLYSQMIVTEPLPRAFWETAGLAARETFADLRRMVVYGQRTADDRLAFGGRGGYHFASAVRPRFDARPRPARALARMLAELFPDLDGVPVTTTWGGAVAAPRDWTASVRFDPGRGLAIAGGYVGDGVATANLAGRTLADLITGTGSDRTTLPWVGHRSRRWEPEPLRWLGITAGLRLVQLADHLEARRTDRPG